MAQDWLDNLEYDLGARLEAWLRQNPRQRELLEEQEIADANADKARISHEARRLRQVLLNQVEEIRRWKQRCATATTMGNDHLATLCRNHLDRCHGDGRAMWQRLEQLGRGRAHAQPELPPMARRWQVTDVPATLMDAWRHFELDQQLEWLKQGGGER